MKELIIKNSQNAPMVSNFVSTKTQGTQYALFNLIQS